MVDGFDQDVCVVGGAGHVGFPLAVALADSGLRVTIFDLNTEALGEIESGEPPFWEPGIQEPLTRVLREGRLSVSAEPEVVARSEHLIVVVGTPVDQYLSPDPEAVPRAIAALGEHLRAGQLIVLRSTVFPGVTRRVEQLLDPAGSGVDLAFCPERIAEGRAMTELFSLPQIVAARTPGATKRAADLFGRLTAKIIELSPEEAELAKLFTNSWRYIKFAAANQYFMLANDLGLDFARIRSAMTEDYPRSADLPGAGFAAGPCLFKDTMQLASVSGEAFALGHSAMLVNEGLPDYLVRRMEQALELPNLTVGILGMAFKAESDDRRSSLSYRLKRVLSFRSARVITTDPYVTDDPELLPLDDVLEQADVLVLGAPHARYADLETELPVVDVWDLLGRGTACMSQALRSRWSFRPTTRRRASAGCSTGWWRASPWRCEILVVVDDEADPTLEAVRRHGGGDPRVRPLVNTYGRGPANAIRYGVDQARHRVVVVTMADGSDDPRRSTRWPAWSSAEWSSPPPRATHPAGSRSAAQCSRALSPEPQDAPWGSWAGWAPTTPPTASRPTPSTSSARSASTAAVGSRSGWS